MCLCGQYSTAGKLGQTAAGGIFDGTGSRAGLQLNRPREAARRTGARGPSLPFRISMLDATDSKQQMKEASRDRAGVARATPAPD
jgi:hypothetical protein